MKLIWQGIALLLTLSATVTGVLLLANVGADEEHLCPPGLSLVAVACFLRNYSELSVGLLGVSGAIFAAWIAWAAVQRQIAEQRAALMLTLMGREEERLEAKLPGIKKAAGFVADLGEALSQLPNVAQVMETITHRTGYGPGKGLEAYLADQLKDIDTSIQNRLVSEIIDLANKARDLERASHELRMVESDLRFTREKTDYSTEAARSRSVEAMRSKSQSAKDNHTKAAALVETAIKAVMDGGAALRTKVSDYEARLTLFKTPAHRPFLMTHASPTPARPMLFRATSE